MLKFNQVQSMPIGTVLRQPTGWKDNKVVSWVEWKIDKINPNSIDLFCPNAVWGQYQRFNRSDFPVQYWSVGE